MLDVFVGIYYNIKKITAKVGGNMNTKKYVYEYDDYEDGNCDAETMAEQILNDPDLSSLDEIVVGCWGESYDNGAQAIIDVFVNNPDAFANISSLFIGDMDYEECEVSWIEQGNYSKLWAALPNLKKLTIKGATELELGAISHAKLESLELISGGLPSNVLASIAKADLPKLEKLNLYIGVEDYGFSGDIAEVKAVVDQCKNFPSLKYLGIGDSELQDEIAEYVMNCKVLESLETLDFSNGTLSDVGAKSILEKKDRLVALKTLNLNYHFMSDTMMETISKLPFEVLIGEQQVNDEEYGNYPMLTE